MTYSYSRIQCERRPRRGRAALVGLRSRRGALSSHGSSVLFPADIFAPRQTFQPTVVGKEVRGGKQSREIKNGWCDCGHGLHF
jgi:hypothetical protein